MAETIRDPESSPVARRCRSSEREHQLKNGETSDSLVLLCYSPRNHRHREPPTPPGRRGGLVARGEPCERGHAGGTPGPG